jgi:hypothetical protein
VQNRSQKEIERNVPVDEARRLEKSFFEKHEEFGACVQDNPSLFGVESLTHKLSQILFSRIEECLPQIISEVKSLFRKTRTQIEQLGNLVPEDDDGKPCICFAYIMNTSSLQKNLHSKSTALNPNIIALYSNSTALYSTSTALYSNSPALYSNSTAQEPQT